MTSTTVVITLLPSLCRRVHGDCRRGWLVGWLVAAAIEVTLPTSSTNELGALGLVTFGHAEVPSRSPVTLFTAAPILTTSYSTSTFNVASSKGAGGRAAP